MSGKEQIKNIAAIVELVGGKSFKKFNEEKTDRGSLLTFADAKLTDEQLREINDKIESSRGRAILKGTNLEIRVYYVSE